MWRVYGADIESTVQAVTAILSLGPPGPPLPRPVTALAGR